jgi:hypothetical protein
MLSRDIKTKLAIAAALIVVAGAPLGVIQTAMAKKGTPFQAGFDHGCNDEGNVLCKVYQSTWQRSQLSHTRIYEWI